MKRLIPYGLIVVGSFIYSVGLNAFISANQLAEGGFVGISLVLFYKLHILTGLSYFVFNIPVLYLGWRFFGREFIAKTFVGVVAVSLFTVFTVGFAQHVGDRLLAALYGGVICGAGLGLIFRSGGTTGGVDILARIARHYFGFSMGRLLFSSDVVVIAIVALILGKEIAMYSLVALFVSSRVIDYVIEGVSSSHAAMVISEKNAEIADRIHRDLGRGTTFLRGRGGYTGSDKDVLYCVVSRDEIVRLQKAVALEDEDAFVVVHEVHDVLGEGFSR
ncbi:YitT family protein [Ferroacidibacillus organovorans]|uniref:DUF2179 domain-containing protein n=1 Tax=Ferroacidibacillus organovorans TaxID=1765683 RepID=A0A101XSP6_9BACL|nr:YitT family protein [Ferroacidibacillus organovorans]KUO96852.1 hypothetical protein ATW55_08570 [Ferroacidibacillus organovorans]